MKGGLLYLWLLVLFCAVAGNPGRGGGRSGGRGGSSGSRGGSNSAVTTEELRRESEALLRADTGLAQPTLSYQGRTSGSASNDNAPNNLISSMPLVIMQKATVRTLANLLDNYIADTRQREVATQGERAEETAFLDAVMATNVMKELEAFLRRKNMLSGSGGLRQILDDIWFMQYRRGGRNIASSGFEHVFVGEVKGGKVSGFHNWLNFKKEEAEGDLDYKGYMKTVDLNGKGSIVKLRFVWLNHPKPVGSVFVGTTPELEMALYTMCFLAKPDSRCNVQLAGHRFQIQTWTYTNRGKKVIGSAYPEI